MHSGGRCLWSARALSRSIRCGESGSKWILMLVHWPVSPWRMLRNTSKNAIHSSVGGKFINVLVFKGSILSRGKIVGIATSDVFSPIAAAEHLMIFCRQGCLLLWVWRLLHMLSSYLVMFSVSRVIWKKKQLSELRSFSKQWKQRGNYAYKLYLLTTWDFGLLRVTELRRPLLDLA